MPPTRARYSGDVEALAACIAPHATSPVFFKYDELPRKGAEQVSKTNPTAILRHKSLVQGLLLLAPNLAFTKEVMESALQKVLEQASWSLPPDQEESWRTTVGSRIRCMCRHVAQALLKNRGAGWVQQLLAPGAEPVSAAAASSASAAAVAASAVNGVLPYEAVEAVPPAPPKKAAKVIYFYGYSKACCEAYRTLPATGEMEFTSDIFFPEGSGPTHPAHARWLDGHVAVITDLTKAAYENPNMQKTDETPVKREVLWSGTHTKTGSQLTIVWRMDRGRLASLFEGKNQKCQLAVHTLGGEGKMQEAVDILTKVGEEYISDAITVDELYKCRDELLKAAGYELPRKGLAKRPAAHWPSRATRAAASAAAMAEAEADSDATADATTAAAVPAAKAKRAATKPTTKAKAKSTTAAATTTTTASTEATASAATATTPTAAATTPAEAAATPVLHRRPASSSLTLGEVSASPEEDASPVTPAPKRAKSKAQAKRLRSMDMDIFDDFMQPPDDEFVIHHIGGPA